MCGRYAVTLPKEAMRQLFHTVNTVEQPPRYNVAPTQPMVTVREGEAGRTMQFARWGYVPPRLMDPRKIPLLINIRSDSMVSRPPFRDALAHRRCIVPADGYYEWLVRPDGRKQPYFITLADGAPMVFAGLYSVWEGPSPTGEPIETVAIVTTDAGPDTASIHNRSPVILRDDEIDSWLDTAGVGTAQAASLAHPLESGSVSVRAVSTRVNAAANDGPDLVEEIDPEAEPATAAPRTKKKAGRGGGGQLDLF